MAQNDSVLRGCVLGAGYRPGGAVTVPHRELPGWSPQPERRAATKHAAGTFSQRVSLHAVTDKAQHDGATSAAPYTARRIEEMDAGFSGHFVRARAELGVQSFGISILLLGPDFEGYPEHDHGRDHQEEVYLALSGSGTLVVDGEPLELNPDALVRVGWQARRKVLAGPDGIRLLVLGGRPGHAYEPPPFSYKGAADNARRVGPDAGPAAGVR